MAQVRGCEDEGQVGVGHGGASRFTRSAARLGRYNAAPAPLLCCAALCPRAYSAPSRFDYSPSTLPFQIQHASVEAVPFVVWVCACVRADITRCAA